MSNREQESYQGGLRNLNADAAAKCLLNSGYFHASSLTIRTAYADAIAIGYVEEALATLELYDVPLTQPM